MRTGELAERLGVSRETVRNYTNEFAEHLSPGATGTAPNAKRQYSERDAIVLATVADLRNQGLNIAQIHEALRNGKRVEKLPTIPTPDEKEARERVALVPISELNRALDRVQTMQAELDRLREERDRILSTWQTDVTELNKRIAELERELGTTAGRLEALELERQPASWWLRIVVILLLGALVIAAAAIVMVSLGGR